MSLTILSALLLGLSACGANTAVMNVDSGSKAAVAEYHKAEAVAEDPAESMEGSSGVSDLSQEYLIKDYRLSLNVKDSQEAFNQAKDLIKKYDGSISRVEQSDSNYKYIYCEAKIPVESAESAASDLKSLGEVDNFSVSTENATNRVVDIKTRLEIKEKQLKKMQELLDQEQSVENVIQINNTIIQLQTEIEAIQKEQKELTKDVEYASFYLDISLNHNEVVDKPHEMITAQSFIKQLGLALQNSFINFVNTCSSVFIWLVAHALELILLVLIIIGVVKLTKKYKAKRKKED